MMLWHRVREVEICWYKSVGHLELGRGIAGILRSDCASDLPIMLLDPTEVVYLRLIGLLVRCIRRNFCSMNSTV